MYRIVETGGGIQHDTRGLGGVVYRKCHAVRQNLRQMTEQGGDMGIDHLPRFIEQFQIIGKKFGGRGCSRTDMNCPNLVSLVVGYTFGKFLTGAFQ